MWVGESADDIEVIVSVGGGRSTKIKTSPAVFRRLPSTTVVPDLATTANA